MIEVATFGCRVNIAESEIIRQKAGEAGLRDAFIVNGCAVTGEAVRQARQAARRARRANPARPVYVTGCAAQTEAEAFAAMPEVTHVIGNREKLTAEAYRTGTRMQVGDAFANPAPLNHALSTIEGHTRGFVQVQNGCDHRCTFCVIPFGRGASRSLAPADVVEAVRRFVEAGAREVVLTGVDLTSYGRDLAGDIRLGALVRLILKTCPDLPRLRLSSLDCIEIDEALFAAFADEERLMPSVHLSLQAGDDLILKRMKRRHSRQDAMALSARLKQLRPDLVLSADLIAGFPTETEAQFSNTLGLIEECGLARVHAFAYSARPGTPAARMPQVEVSVIKERARRLREAGAAAFNRCLDRQIGSLQMVLAERGGIARTPAALAVKSALPAGVMGLMRLTAHDGETLTGVAA